MRKSLLIFAALMCLLSVHAHALPALQAHLINSVAGDRTSPTDQDTWFNTTPASSPQRVELIAAYTNGITNISDGYLVLTVSPNDPNPAGPNFRFFYETGPNVLTEILNIRDYRYEDNAAFEKALATASGLPVNFNNHSPYGMPSSQIDVYGIPLNVLQAGLGDFRGLLYKSGSSGFKPAIHRSYQLKDCNADTSSSSSSFTTPPTTNCTDNTQSGLLGEIKTIGFATKNADFVHIDFVAKITTGTSGIGKATSNKSWGINPGSHDSTISVPEPTSLALFATGLLLLIKRRRAVLMAIRR